MSAIAHILLALELATATPDCGAAANATLVSRTEGLIKKQSNLEFSSEALRDSNGACVRVEFKILADGHAGAVKIAETSGELALDKAAVDALRRFCFSQPGRDEPNKFTLVFQPHGLMKNKQ